MLHPFVTAEFTKALQDDRLADARRQHLGSSARNRRAGRVSVPKLALGEERVLHRGRRVTRQAADLLAS